MQILDTAWQNWINENFARGCTYEAMLADMVKAGIAQDVAVFNLSNRSGTAGASDEGVANQQSGPYEQEASYLLQQDNTIVTQDGQHIQVAMRVIAPDVVLLVAASIGRILTTSQTTLVAVFTRKRAANVSSQLSCI